MGLFKTLHDNYVPLSDETSRKYYEIVYGLLSSLASVHYDGVKNYVEFHLGQTCDEEKLKDALSNFNERGNFYNLCSESSFNTKATTKGFTPQKIKKLIEINKELDIAKNYRYPSDQALRICFKEIIDKISLEYDNVLNVVEEQGCKFFNIGLDNIIGKYIKVLNKGQVEYLIRNITADYYFKGNPIVKDVFYKYFNLALKKNCNDDYITSIALKAIHFEKSDKNLSGYSSISEEECRSFILNDEDYLRKINEHPFEKEEYIRRYISFIRCAPIFLYRDGTISAFVDFWLPQYRTEFYYTDLVCNDFCKELLQQSTDSELSDIGVYEIINMLWDYVQNI